MRKLKCYRFSYFPLFLHSSEGHFFISREMEEITAFIKGAICDDQCLGRCLYIHGVPGTGKVGSVIMCKIELCCLRHASDSLVFFMHKQILLIGSSYAYATADNECTSSNEESKV